MLYLQPLLTTSKRVAMLEELESLPNLLLYGNRLMFHNDGIRKIQGTLKSFQCEDISKIQQNVGDTSCFITSTLSCFPDWDKPICCDVCASAVSS